MSTILEFIRDTPMVTEKIDKTDIKCFEVPRTKYFAKGELLYLGFMLNLKESEVQSKINEMKLGRKTIEKVYACRLDGDPWSSSRLILPSLLDNDVDLTQLDPIGNATLRVYLHFNGVKNVLCVALHEYDEYREITITKLKGVRGIVRYIVYF